MAGHRLVPGRGRGGTSPPSNASLGADPILVRDRPSLPPTDPGLSKGNQRMLVPKTPEAISFREQIR